MFRMRKTATNGLFLLALLSLFLLENHASSITEAPTPQPQTQTQTQPQPQPQPQTQPHSNLPMQGTTEGSLHPQECGGRCTTRCSKTQYKKPCMFFCQKCCAKCLCVPPGTYGNKQTCACYNNWKTKRGGPKCP